jgi:hypothetical protein
MKYEQKRDDSLGWKRSLGRQLNTWPETITGYMVVTGRMVVVVMLIMTNIVTYRGLHMENCVPCSSKPCWQ